MVSSFDFNTETVHDGVTRRSEAIADSVLLEATVTMTEMSVGVPWNAIAMDRLILTPLFFLSVTKI